MKRKLIYKYLLATNCQTEFMRCNWICKMQLLSHTFEFCALKCMNQVFFMVYLYSSEIKWKIFQKYLKISKFFSSDFLFPPQTKSRQRIALFQVVPETIVVKRQKRKRPLAAASRWWPWRGKGWKSQNNLFHKSTILQ